MAVDYKVILWDAAGKPYWGGGGQPVYIPPATAVQTDDPKLKAWGQAHAGRPGQSLLKTGGTWNSKTGAFDRGVNYGNLLSMAVGGAMAAPAIGAAVGGGAAAGASSAAGTGAAGAGGAAATTGGGMGVGTLIKYGLEYGLPVAANLIGTKMQTNAQSDADKAMADYYQRALDAAIEEQTYQRGVGEEDRRYGRGVDADARRYGRYGDTYDAASGEESLRYGRAGDDYDRRSDEDTLAYGRASDTYNRAGSEDSLLYGRAKDTYGRLSDEEILAYGRSQNIRDKNYGYQQYGNFVETLEPYRAAGSAATSRASQLIGGPATPSTGSYLNLAQTARGAVQDVPTVPNRPTWDFTANRPTFDYTANRPTWDYTPDRPTWNPPVEDITYQPPTSGSAQSAQLTEHGSGPDTQGTNMDLLTVEAPDGEVRELPRAEAEAYIRLGARLVRDPGTPTGTREVTA